MELPIQSRIVRLLIIAWGLIFTTLPVGIGTYSVYQTLATFFVSYLLHFWINHTKFKNYHIINLISFVISLVMSIVFRRFTHMTQRLSFGMILFVLQEFLLARYDIGRGGFAGSQKPIDVFADLSSKREDYTSELNKDDVIMQFSDNIKNDLVDSIVAFTVYIVGSAFLIKDSTNL